MSVILRLEGPDTGGHRLWLSALTEKMRQLDSLLKGGIEHSERKGAVIEVVDLSHSSPAEVECQITVGGRLDSVVSDGINGVFSCVYENQTGEENQNGKLDDRVLWPAEKLATLDRNRIYRAELRIDNGHPWNLNSEFLANIKSARGEEYVEISTVDGLLEEINIHNQKYSFKIYAWAPDNAVVTCQFPKKLLAKVRGALGLWVSVSGECHNRPRAIMPYKIDVHKIKVMPPSDSLPSLNDLWGIAPEATGDKTPEKFVRDLRDQWDRG